MARTGRSRAARSAVAATLLVGGLTALQLAPGPLGAGEAAASLVPYAGCEELVEGTRAELRRATTSGASSGGVGVLRAEAAATATAADAAVAPGPTGTNLQERGVDEPDVAKLAGDLLVSVGSGGLHVVRAGPSPELLATLALPGGGLDASELLLVGDRALVLEQGHTDLPEPVGRGPAAVLSLPVASTTTLHLADLSDPDAPRWLERWQVDGAYVSARLVDGTVRLVTRSVPTTTADRLTVDDVVPQAEHQDAAGAVRSSPAVDCADVSSSPGARGGALVLVTTLRPADGLAPVDSDAVAVDGDLVHASADRLVVATSRWGTGPADRAQEVSTELHAFDTTRADRTTYVGSGSVAGSVPGRWALSWHEGALRVTSTSSDGTSTSSVSVLRERDGALRQVGRLDGLGPDEQVQAVRYFGDVGVVVTFRLTDPLYVLDLADPARPALLGELAVPGFSAYLHPLGDGLLLSVGMEADAATGQTTGMQASVFDLRDLARPVQVSRLQLGEAYSDVLGDSRAFGHDPARRLAVLPLISAAGRSSALGIAVGEDGALREAGRLAAPGGGVQRVLLGGDHVYAVGDGGVVAATADELRRTGSARFG